MKFKELQDLANTVADKLKEYVSVGVSYDNHPHTKELVYEFYHEKGPNTLKFKTVQNLKAHMENILNPPVDEGVELDEKEEACQTAPGEDIPFP